MKTIENNSMPMGQERGIGQLEETTLAALEEMDDYYRQWKAQQEELRELYVRILSAYLHPGALVDLNDRAQHRVYRFLAFTSVVGGNSRGTRIFRIESLPRVEVHADGDPCLSYWTCEAAPISAATGNAMSGRVSHGVGSKFCTLRGPVFNSNFDEHSDDRDAFIDFVADTEAKSLYPLPDHSAHNSAVARKKSRL